MSFPKTSQPWNSGELENLSFILDFGILQPTLKLLHHMRQSNAAALRTLPRTSGGNWVDVFKRKAPGLDYRNPKCVRAKCVQTTMPN
jgi:hypothetical protein